MVVYFDGWMSVREQINTIRKIIIIILKTQNPWIVNGVDGCEWMSVREQNQDSKSMDC